MSRRLPLIGFQIENNIKGWTMLTLQGRGAEVIRGLYWQYGCLHCGGAVTGLSLLYCIKTVGTEPLNVSIKQVSDGEDSPMGRQNQAESAQAWAHGSVIAVCHERCWVTQPLLFLSASVSLISSSTPPLCPFSFPLLVVFFPFSRLVYPIWISFLSVPFCFPSP